MEAKHTPLTSAGNLIHNARGLCIAEVFSRGSDGPEPFVFAEFIVRACNTHDKLVEVCKGDAIIEALDELSNRFNRYDIARVKQLLELKQSQLNTAIAEAEKS